MIEVKPIDTTKAIAVQSECDLILNDAKQLIIKDNDQYTLANELLKKVKGKQKELDVERKSITKPIDIAKKAAMDLYRPSQDALTKAENVLKNGIVTFATEQEKKRKADEEKLRKEEEKKAKAKQGKLNERAEKAEAEGKTEKADELREQAEEVETDVAFVLPESTERQQGVHFKENWKAQVFDENIVPRKYMIIDYKKLDKLAQAIKGKSDIPGVKFVSEKTVVAQADKGLDLG